MRVLYQTESKDNEGNISIIDKVMDSPIVTFYPDSQEIGIGNRKYKFSNNGDEDWDFERFEVESTSSGCMDVRGFNYTVKEYEAPQKNYRNNYRRGNNGGYRRNNGGYNRRRY